MRKIVQIIVCFSESPNFMYHVFYKWQSKKKNCTWKHKKVQSFWEAHKNLRNLPHALDIYLVNVQSMRKIFSNFVCLSESPNFEEAQQMPWSKYVVCRSAWFISNHKTSWFYFSPKLNFTRVNTADPVHFTLTPPECHMEIRNGYGTTGTRVAGPVHVGDPLTLMILMRSAWGKFFLISF